MPLTGNTPLTGKQPQQSPEVGKSRYDAGLSYLTNGAPEAAYVCFNGITQPGVHTLFNKALCCYLSGWYQECYRLLGEAERYLPAVPSREEVLPPPLSANACNDRLHLCPMPRGVPPALSRIQLLRLKAEAAFRLQLYSEVKALAASLQKPYRHIEKLIKQLSHEIE